MRYAKWIAASHVGLCIELGVQLVIGLVLSLAYTATVEGAHTAVAAMHSGGMKILQGMHYWGSAVFILHSLVHLKAMTWFGWFRRPYGARYLSSVLMLLTALGFQLSGNLLPFDRHGVQTATIEASIAARAPVVGPMSSHFVLNGNDFGQNTLSLWYTAHHWLLLIPALLALGLAFAPVERRQRVSWGIALAPLVLVLLLAVAVPSPLGSAATPADYDAFAARSSWYVWPLHGAMRLFDNISTGLGWIGAMLLPGLAVLFVLLLPTGRISLKGARLGWSIFSVFFLFCGIFLGGSPADLTGTRDPATVAEAKPIDKNQIDAALVAKGRQIFNKMECADCHGTDGAKAGGGPALTNVWKRHSDADYYIRYILKPTSVQPDSTMPAFPKTPADDLKAIAEFLRSPKN